MPHSRSERRRTARPGVNAPPRRRDPMNAIYLGVGIVILALVIIFGGMRWQQNRVLVAANATPTPGPAASAKPIQLADGGSIGKPHFKQYNTPQGGRGQAVDGITCAGMEYATLHVHAHLALFVKGTQIQIPRLLGASPTASGGCLYWIHTHDASGIIHIESPSIQAPQGGAFTLGMLFDIWGEPLGPTGVAGFHGPVVAFVNGSEYGGPLRSIPLSAHQQIVLEVGHPIVPPPNYTFPIGD